MCSLSSCALHRLFIRVDCNNNNIDTNNYAHVYKYILYWNVAVGGCAFENINIQEFEKVEVNNWQVE